MQIHSPADCSGITLPNLDALASTTGLLQRESKKFSATHFLQSLICAVITGRASLNQIAVEMGQRIGRFLSKQALHKRLGDFSTAFLTEVMAHLIASRIRQASGQLNLSIFKRILIEDSSFCAMRRSNAEDFPAHGNGRVATAGFKVDLAYDLLTNEMVSVTLHGATEQDKSIGKQLLDSVRPGDLVLRDMGYFVISEFAHIEQVGAYWLSRLPVHTKVKVKGGDSLEEALLKDPNRRRLDLSVQLGNVAHPCRLIAVRAKKSVCKKRREQRRKAAHAKGRELGIEKTIGWIRDGWHLLLTNVATEQCGANELMMVYRMRWDIEIQFRGWKQSMNLKDALNRTSSKAHLTALILAAIIHQILGLLIRAKCQKSAGIGEISIEKLYDLLSQYQLKAPSFEAILLFTAEIRHIKKERRRRKIPVKQGVQALS